MVQHCNGSFAFRDFAFRDFAIGVIRTPTTANPIHSENAVLLTAAGIVSATVQIRLLVCFILYNTSQLVFKPKSRQALYSLKMQFFWMLQG